MVWFLFWKVFQMWRNWSPCWISGFSNICSFIYPCYWESSPTVCHADVIHIIPLPVGSLLSVFIQSVSVSGVSAGRDRNWELLGVGTPLTVSCSIVSRPPHPAQTSIIIAPETERANTDQTALGPDLLICSSPLSLLCFHASFCAICFIQCNSLIWTSTNCHSCIDKCPMGTFLEDILTEM